MKTKDKKLIRKEIENLKNLIEIAKEQSKQKFLKFVTEIYNVDKCIFEHILRVPIIEQYEEFIEESPLSSKSKEEITDILDKIIKDTIGTQNSCIIDFKEVGKEFEYKEIEEWEEKINRGNVIQEYDFIIVYNEEKLENEWKKFKIENENIKTEELEKIFTKNLIDNFLYKLCKINSKAILDKDVEKLVDILVLMIDNYKDGDTIQDCLCKVTEQKNYNFDDKLILKTYTLFPEELTEWLIYGAYESVKVNKLKEKIIEISEEESLKTEEDTKAVKNEEVQKNNLILLGNNKKSIFSKVIEKIKKLFLHANKEELV